MDVVQQPWQENKSIATELLVFPPTSLDPDETGQ